MILREGLTLSLIGLVVGLVGAVWLGQLLSGLVFGVAPSDPPTFVAVSVLLTVGCGGGVLHAGSPRRAHRSGRRAEVRLRPRSNDKSTVSGSDSAQMPIAVSIQAHFDIPNQVRIRTLQLNQP